MPFGLTKDHLDFYYKNQFIEFEALLSPEEVNQLESGLDTVIKKERWTHAGHDAWRKDSQIKKITLRKDFAEIASHLSKKQTLRIAYDQAIRGPLSTTSWTLTEMSAIRKIASAMLVQLGSSSPTFSPFIPQIRGNATFLSPECPLVFPENVHLFLIVYSPKDAQYVYEKRDPNVHALKKFGYVFGDHLNSQTHPLLLSS